MSVRSSQRIGAERRNAILLAAAERPGTVADLAARTDQREASVRRHLNALVEKGLLVRWGVTPRTQVFGREADRNGAPRDADEAILLAAARPGTIRELAERSGLSESTVSLRMRELRRKRAVRRVADRYRAT